jgi:hypothetical protein
MEVSRIEVLVEADEIMRYLKDQDILIEDQKMMLDGAEMDWDEQTLTLVLIG